MGPSCLVWKNHTAANLTAINSALTWFYTDSSPTGVWGRCESREEKQVLENPKKTDDFGRGDTFLSSLELVACEDPAEPKLSKAVLTEGVSGVSSTGAQNRRAPPDLAAWLQVCLPGGLASEFPHTGQTGTVPCWDGRGPPFPANPRSGWSAWAACGLRHTASTSLPFPSLWGGLGSWPASCLTISCKLLLSGPQDSCTPGRPAFDSMGAEGPPLGRRESPTT
ncbi:hypothetical protein VULLAG_LOCUS4579 [Vulpes lagopus]